MMQPQSIAFEQIVVDLLKRTGHTDVRSNVVLEYPGRPFSEVDILFGPPQDLTVVEVKHYRYRSPPKADLIVRALATLAKAKKTAHAKNKLLVMSCPLGPAFKAYAQAFDSTAVWDGPMLFQAAAPHPDLISRLEIALEITLSEAMLGLQAESPVKVLEADQAAPELESSVPPEPARKGKALAEELLRIPPGRKDATLFENKCIEALKYLFESDLFGWHEQHSTVDGLHRRDLICRVLPNSEVWKFMLRDLESRYVIFEFKNYTDEITQSEIISTERYLYPKALRKVAILISPKGCTVSAANVVQGAMREHGKLMLSLKVSNIVEWLKGKDEGSDPNTYLFAHIDDFLMRLGR
ncbi:MAG: restriction endonuclease [Gammaproteobacteria bacterium]|nr:restriction endonuclease [Gammaproteobacteria bacterium]MBU1505798.1 restriction endonuclease [Gammaproteobacteria bacterium]MBU2119486.1 restriction endonuclease [Gammaproteobacteria bacterium]MBU2172608.1 restriction endonuclease [Gammaproteobacteria bacterium]MBU2202066.1 restriction endonuclease [Gammaproteobacteria bacterium]